MDRETAERVLLAGGWLALQAPAFQSRVLAHGRLKPFVPGEHSFHAGDDLGGIYGVVSGGFAVLLTAGNAGPTLATIIRPPVWFGHGPLMTRRRRLLGFRATEPSWALHVPLAALEEIARALPDAPRAIGAISDFTIDIAIRTVGDLLIRQGDRRIAATLLRITGAVEGGQPDDPAGFRLTQAELGEMANASRAVVNRTLGTFERRGWVRLGYQRIAVLDAESLTAFATTPGR